jgi:dimethylaniline monooxygenase (N-oxide forming)
MYRFHPAVKYSQGYPKRDEILANVRGIWEKYHLKERTRFNTKVEKVTRHSSSTDPQKKGHGRWIVNGDESVVYDGLVATVGTCGAPKKMELPEQDSFKGQVVHSSQLDDIDLTGKRVVCVGSGASAVEGETLPHLYSQ